jgi:BlaI family transcriptional regulator, penicillinase repressor
MKLGRKRKPPSQLTRLELEIMEVLWSLRTATVQEVQEAIPNAPLAYTTVQTMLNILHRKGRVKRKLVGKAYTYSPVLSRDRAVREAVGDMVDRLFGGSIEALVMNLLQSNQLDPEKLAKLNELVSKQGREGENGSD